MTLADDRARFQHVPAPQTGLSATRSSEPLPDGFSLDDRYTRESGTIYLSGIQALVRMVRDRARVDRRQNLTTASFISGYEGSPLAGYDLELARRRDLLAPYDIVHRPGLNEEIAATSVMGSQVAAQVAELSAAPDGTSRDGVVGYWYGKAPGLDRATDAIRHANLVGTHPSGGAVALVGDDPGAKSSTVPCASEMALADLYIPILYPADSQDILDLGVHAAIMSRVSGLWTSLKISAHVADGSSTAHVDPDRIIPTYGDLGRSPHVPSGRLLGTNLMELEQNQLTTRIPRAQEYARLNGINQIVVSTPDDRIGIVAAGKTYLDLREALRLMHISDDDLRRLGIRLLKLGMVYPIERDILNRFMFDTARGDLDEVIVIEEKRDFIETMMRDILFRHPRAPRIVGKVHEDGSTLFSRFGELDVDAVTRGLADRLARHHVDAAQAWIDKRSRRRTRIELPLAVRTPYFCSGCPHNSSTKVSEDTLVGAGIGCHAMVLLMDPRQVGDVAGITQMGGEGAQWIGMAPFVSADHFVQNVGDGTFMHSGSLALRAAVASGENITYKLLYNGTVAMTGGQDPVGAMDLPRLTSLLLDEGVHRIVVTSDDPKRTRALCLPKDVEVRHRDELGEVQTELAGVPGVTVLIHDQHCAAEKRRKRKRGTMPTPTTRVMINERICEGCGDCGEKSNCLSVHPVHTEFGRKTQIDQSSCNLDYSCLKGDCPSFVTVTPGTTRTRQRAGDIPGALLPEPSLPAVRDTFSLRVTGIGGTGVVTVSQVLATAAVLDGHAARTVDMTGLAQKGGAVVSDIKVAPHDVEQAAKVATDDCDLYLVCDPLVGTDPVNLKVAAPEKTVAVVSTTQVPTGLMVIDTSVGFPAETAIHSAIDAHVTRGLYLDSGALSTALFGDEQFANMVMVGAAYQAGALAISASSIERAIELNGVAVDANVQAFRRGRQAVADADAVSAAIASLHGAATAEPEPSEHAMGVVRAGGFGDESARTVALRYDELTAYADERYAREYLDVVERVHRGVGSAELTDGVARNLYKLMAYKDEYEVARLTQDAAFAAKVAEEFGDDAEVAVRLHPPTLRRMGMREKMTLGGWANRPLKSLASMKRLRGTALDPFGRNEIRRTERALIIEYREMVDALLAAMESGKVRESQLPTVVELAGLPDMVRGYESVKMRNVEKYRAEVSRLRQALGV
ncbi:indolepyruvate ferredoxin oxidoreductase family protein [Gordonia amicalis]|uniref:Indolepyruvate ferredoxin oxidoreductase family protein n=1 Tax=Gordonia amicalis TaxID=89053 RepID=A0AAE4R4I5_9ACTN|nr:MULTISPECIES: indolepyruvate ferredoxin oxidoreductase family protein [Gordonia]ATD69978.1 2-oxoacid ferredoxin oxidoreductase [Gordonia sp. 1D]MCZ4578851.1 indolepyruvate ferredoxin oxidoreductase family protein [Gordonia amicalis]MDV6306949.1 indolepyruvate ferredoxin oxidoreductase family protein [Gordonia amicalis]MDV6311697.1 indolepyruvate ferredoxin oxidoreductase family protein [Gordonia amicalis]UPW13611.1 indolepyruvate ferredoxin oxidoreductase family protein [Gordonia amicalis]